MTNANYRIEKMEITGKANGATFGIALGHNEKGNMWVTWCFKANDNGESEIDFFWGHYYDRERDATIDYHQRIIEDLK